MRQAFAKGERFGILKRETRDHLRTLSAAAYVQRLTKDRLFVARGEAWEEFFR